MQRAPKGRPIAGTLTSYRKSSAFLLDLRDCVWSAGTVSSSWKKGPLISHYPPFSTRMVIREGYVGDILMNRTLIMIGIGCATLFGASILMQAATLSQADIRFMDMAATAN